MVHCEVQMSYVFMAIVIVSMFFLNVYYLISVMMENSYTKEKTKSPPY